VKGNTQVSYQNVTSNVRARRGDVVKCVHRYYETIAYGERFVITDTTDGGSKIRIKPEVKNWCSYSTIWYNTKNFELVTPSNEKETPVANTFSPKNFVVIGATGNREYFDDYESVNAYLTNALTISPSAKYHIYAYQNTAQTKPAQVDFVDAREPVPAKVVTST
jgi:hypothetical protein